MLALEPVSENLDFGLVGFLEEFEDLAVGKLLVEGAIVDRVIITVELFVFIFGWFGFVVVGLEESGGG